MSPETEARILKLIERLQEALPEGDQRAESLIAALRTELKHERADQEERDKMLAAYEEAYNKLTAPAN